MVIATAASANAPAHISRIAMNTVRGCPGRGRIHIRAAPLSRSRVASPLGRRCPSWAQASSTARISSPFSRRNHRG